MRGHFAFRTYDGDVRQRALALVTAVALSGCITYRTGTTFRTTKGYLVAAGIETALYGATVGVSELTTDSPHLGWSAVGVVGADALFALLVTFLAVPPD